MTSIGFMKILDKNKMVLVKQDTQKREHTQNHTFSFLEFIIFFVS